MGYVTGKYIVCRRPRATFNPEILQAGAEKGLMPQVHRDHRQRQRHH